MLPDQWIRPVISTAILPGHAEISANCNFDVSLSANSPFEISVIGFGFSAPDVPDGTEFFIEINSESGIAGTCCDLAGIVSAGEAVDIEVEDISLVAGGDPNTEIEFLVEFDNGQVCSNTVNIDMSNPD